MASRESEVRRALIRYHRAEAQMDAVVHRALMRTANTVLKAADEAPLTNAALTAALTRPDQLRGILGLWRTQALAHVLPVILGIYRAEARDMTKRMGLTGRLPAGFHDTLRNTRADAYLASRTNMIVGIGETAFRDTADALQMALEAGDGIPKAAEAVREQLAVNVRRATTIARTEVGTAINSADYAVAEELAVEGLVATKEWLATSDGRTRPDHADANGQTVGIKDPFIVGGVEMDHPNDPAAPADQTINCRCVALYNAE